MTETITVEILGFRKQDVEQIINKKLKEDDRYIGLYRPNSEKTQVFIKGKEIKLWNYWLIKIMPNGSKMPLAINPNIEGARLE